MEGILLDSGALTAAISYGAFVVLALVAAGVLFGSMAERERNGESIYWSAEPIPGTGEPEVREEPGVRHAA